MNKNILLGLIILLLLLGVFFNYNFYINNKKQALKENYNLIQVQFKIKKINYLKSKHNLNLKFVKKICNIEKFPTKIILECKNLNKNDFSNLQIIFKKAKINKFIIKKVKNKVYLKAEINK